MAFQQTYLSSKNLINSRWLFQRTFCDDFRAHFFHIQHKCIQWLLDMWLLLVISSTVLTIIRLYWARGIFLFYCLSTKEKILIINSWIQQKLENRKLKNKEKHKRKLKKDQQNKEEKSMKIINSIKSWIQRKSCTFCKFVDYFVVVVVAVYCCCDWHW